MPQSKKPRKKKSSSKKKGTGAGRIVPLEFDEPLAPEFGDDVMERNIRRLAALDFRPVSEETAWRARELVDQAWETEDDLDAVELFAEAMEIDPVCVDAYLGLLETLPPPADVERTILEVVVAAAAYALGPETFEREAGAFWDLLEARPYMRARARLADLLWDAAEYDEAVAHYEGLLDLNPNDNQGIRYILLTRYLDLGESKSAEALIDTYPEDDSPHWVYTRALLAFRDRGDGEEARTRLREAAESNPHVPVFLLGKERLLDEGATFEIGGPDEASAYAKDSRLIWRRMHGALAWLARSAPELSPAD